MAHPASYPVGISLVLKWLGYEADHSPTCSAVVLGKMAYVVKFKDIFTLPHSFREQIAYVCTYVDNTLIHTKEKGSMKIWCKYY